MSFESHVTLLHVENAEKSAAFAFRHPIFVDDAMHANLNAQAVSARLMQEQPKCPDIPLILRRLIETEKSVNRTLKMAVVSYLN
jgi:response regulator RpfG family c-di-GMP phosphodiesterase